MSAREAASLVVLLHGVGASGADLAGLGESWAADLPGTVFASPDAPFVSDSGAGRQWFSIAGVTPANRAARVASAREAFDRTLTASLAAHGLAAQLDRVVLVGFSQGAIMALDALATGRWPVAAVVAFCGRLATSDPLSPPPAARLLLVHGEADAVIPAGESLAAAERLRRHGVAAEVAILPRVGHTISREEAALAARFIGKTLPAPP